jgi:hypothetical protein
MNREEIIELTKDLDKIYQRLLSDPSASLSQARALVGLAIMNLERELDSSSVLGSSSD